MWKNGSLVIVLITSSTVRAERRRRLDAIKAWIGDPAGQLYRPRDPCRTTASEKQERDRDAETSTVSSGRVFRESASIRGSGGWEFVIISEGLSEKRLPPVKAANRPRW